MELYANGQHTDVRALFRKTENQELNELFKTIEDKVIFPSHLPQDQRKIVYNTSDPSRLEKNPIVIELEGVEFKFQTINRDKDLPRFAQLIDSVLRTAKTDADWNNLPTLLAGLVKAGHKPRANLHGKIIRVAIQNGHLHAILECAKQAAETGFFIQTREQLTLIVQGISDMINAADGDVQKIDKALKMATTVHSILLQPEHLKHKQARREGGSLQNSILFRGLFVHGRAELYKAKKAAEEPAEGDAVLLADEIQTLGALWSRYSSTDIVDIPTFQQILPRTVYPELPHTSAYLNRRAYVTSLAQHIQAIEVADRLSSANSEDFASVSTSINDSLRPAVNKLDSHLGELLSRVEGEEQTQLASLYSQIVGRELNVSKS
jgi:hypothetical protein